MERVVALVEVGRKIIESQKREAVMMGCPRNFLFGREIHGLQIV
jgi:hypothetical protein